MLKYRRCWKFQLTKVLSVCLSPLCYTYNGKTTIISMILVIETLNLVSRSILHGKSISGIFFLLNLTGYELLALPNSLLPTSPHDTAISIIRLQIRSQNAKSCSTIFYPYQHLSCIGTLDYSSISLAVLLLMDRPTCNETVIITIPPHKRGPAKLHAEMCSLYDCW